MCIVIGKYFEDVGWVGFKNRDRNYLPEISFKKVKKGNLEILYFWDDITQYCEGMNSAGIGVLSASLMVSDDEKEITNRSKSPSKDGIKIKKALTYGDVKAVAMSLIDQKLTGNTLVFNKDHMFLLEGTWRPGEYKAKGYEYVIKEIKKEETVCRTNHGIWIDWAGYQYNPENTSETTSRISSESRLKIAEYVAANAESPIDVLDDLSKNYTNNGQLNAIRTTLKKKMMRTTSQIMIIPSEGTMFIRPVQSHMAFNFWDLNSPDQKLWLEILSNRVLYKNLHQVGDDVSPFNTKLYHNN